MKTLPIFIKRKHPKKGEKNKQRERTKVEVGKKSPKEASYKEVMEP